MPKHTISLLALLAAAMFSTSAIQAEDMDYYWTGAASNTYWATGNWNVDAPYGPIATSGLDDTSNSITAYILDSKGGTINLDFSRLGNAIKSVNIGGGTTPASISRSGGTLTIEANKAVNVLDSGTFTLSQALTINANGALTVNGGTVSSTGAGLSIDGNLNVADGSFTFNNGSNQIQNNGSINVSGGTFNVTSANSIRIGNYSNASLNITDGEVIVDAPAYIGVSANTGTINQSGGNATFNWPLNLGWGNGAVGEYNLTGGTLTTTSDAGLWTGNPSGISTFTVNGGTANFNKTGESFTVGLGGTNELANVFTLTSGTVNAADTFAVKYGGVLNVAGGEFNAQTVSVDSRSSFNMTNGTAAIQSIDMNGGTFIQEGGILKGTRSLAGSYTQNNGAMFVPEGTLAVSNTATVNGIVDMSYYANYVGKYGETLTLISANSASGTPTFLNVPPEWTAAVTGTGVIATYAGGEGNYYWTGATNNTYYTGTNWEVNGTPFTETYLDSTSSPSFTKNAYILTTNGTVTVDYSTLGVASLTVGNGIGGETGTATLNRGGGLDVLTVLTVNKGAEFTVGGAVTVSGRNNVPGLMTVNGGTFNANNTTTISSELAVTGGVYNAAGAVTINYGGTLSIDGGKFNYTSSSNFVTNGTLNLDSGELVVNPGSGSFRIGGANDTAEFVMTGGEATFGSPVYIGTSSNGTVSQSGGTATFDDVLELGWGNYTGTYNLSGGTLNTNAAAGLWNANSSGASTFNVTGGTANFNQDGESFTVGLGGTNELANAFNLSSGEVNAADTFAVKYGGKLNVDGDGVLNAKTLEINSNGTLNLTAGTINPGEGGITSSDESYTINLSGGTFGTNGASWSSDLDADVAEGKTVTFAPEAGKTITWGGNLGGEGDVKVAGEGTFNLTGTANNVVVEDGARLLLDGEILGDLVMNSNLEVYLDDLTEPFIIDGNIAGDGAIEFFTENPLEYLDQKVIFLQSDDTVLDVIAAMFEFPEAGEGFSWDYGQNGNLFWVGLVDSSAANVPEPATWTLLLLGAFGLLYWRKK